MAPRCFLLLLLVSAFHPSMHYGQSPDPLTKLRMKSDYQAGGHDMCGVFMGGTEMMALAGHGGSLYAAVGYGQDVRGADPKTGGQVLRKDAPSGAWIVDAQFDTTVLRTECLLPLTFTRDGSGQRLSQPLRMLARGRAINNLQNG